MATENCFVCKGSGVTDCFSCKSSGIDPDGDPCGACDGRGTVTCGSCDGTGSVETDDDDE